MLKKIFSKDGLRYVEISSDDGRIFRYTELSQLWDGGYGNLPGSFYWTPTHGSGLFETAESAEADARATLSWMRELNSN